MMTESLDAPVRQIVETLQNKQALDILLLDLRSLSDAADFFILCTGTSDQHVKSLADELADTLRAAGDPPWHIEGYGSRRWVLIDCVDIVIHIFRREARQYYALERLWGDAKRISLQESCEASESREGTWEADHDLFYSRI